MSIRLEITEERPEDRPEALAVKLAEALQNAAVQRQVAHSYKLQADSEKVKIQQLQQILIDLKAWLADPPKKISRMDPMATYDLEALKAELQQAKDRNKEFAEKSKEATRKIAEFEKQAIRLQSDIAKSHANGAKRGGSR